MRRLNLTIGWLYPELMNLYGDRGNIICLVKRCEWRGIKTRVLMLNIGFSMKELEECDLLVMGGAQDRQQNAVSEDLFSKKDHLEKLINSELPGLYICGAFQLFGKHYKESDGNIIKGLGIFKLHTENPGIGSDRLIGNISLECSTLGTQLLGFENHGGMTYLQDNKNALGRVISGHGNNDKDDTEGYIYKNSFGTYLHGPILPKNPELADYLIKKSLERKYNTEISLEKLDNTVEDQARAAIAKKIGVKV